MRPKGLLRAILPLAVCFSLASTPALAHRLKPQVINVGQRYAQGLEQKAGGFTFALIEELKGGSVEFFRVEEKVGLHFHPKENHFLYILKGKAKGQIEEITAELNPGDFVVIPARMKHKLERLGDEPVDFLLFSSPPFHPKDIVWVEK